MLALGQYFARYQRVFGTKNRNTSKLFIIKFKHTNYSEENYSFCLAYSTIGYI